MRSIANFLKREWQELLVLLLLLVFFLWIRVSTLEPIEIGGDAIQKWFFVRRWAYPNPLEGSYWNHHFTRMGDNVPVFLLQRLFGTSPPVYYLGPLLAFLVAAFSVYAIGKRAKSRLCGVLAAVGFTMFQPLRRAASQLLPSIFSCMYITLGAYFLLRYAQAEPRLRPRWAVASALCIFGAYLSHEPNVFFVPGFVAILWLYSKSLRHLALFLGVLLGAFLLETAAYASFTPYWSRLHITMATHGDTPGLKVANAWGLLGRFASPDFGPHFKLYFFAWPLAAVGVALLARERFARLVALLPASFLFLATFLVRGIDPIRTWMSYQSRYLIPAVPLIALTHALLLLYLAEFLGRWLVRGASALAARSPPLARLFAPAVEQVAPAPGEPLPATSGLQWRGLQWRGLQAREWAGLLWRGLRWDLPWIALLVAWFCYQRYPGGDLASWAAGNPLFSWQATADHIRDAYTRRLPIVGPKKAVMLAHMVYLDDASLLEGGRLPTHSEKMFKLDRSNWLLSAESSVYEQDARQKRAGKAGGKACVLQLGVNKRFMSARRSRLAASCQAQASPLARGEGL